MPRFKGPISDFTGDKGVWLDNDFKLIDGKLFNLSDDPGEAHDISKKEPARTTQMKAALAKWQAEVSKSLCGEDYGNR